MKINAIFCAGLLLTALCTSCYRNDTRIGEFHVPVITSPECLTILEGRLRGVEGVESVTADFTTQRVLVKFNGLKAALKNIEFAIANAGFDVNETPAVQSVKAALPEGCR